MDKFLVLVSGASGYLGSHCVKRLLDKGYRVRGTVRSLKNPSKVDPVRNLDPTGRLLQLVEADLNEENTWPQAVSGCDFVLHVASPFPMGGSQETIDTAINGTMIVLRACANEASVKKVVLTSSCVAVAEGHRDSSKRLDESDWSIIDNASTAYIKSKVLAEQAAWNFVGKEERKNPFAFTVINPGFIVGPPLIEERGTSVEVVTSLMSLPAVPRLTLNSIDVRDAAEAHVNAMERPQSDGKRILCCEAEPRSFSELCKKLGSEFEPQGYCVTKRTLPDFIVKFGALFSSQLDGIKGRLGMETRFDNSKLRSLLDVTPRDTSDSIVEMVYDLIERGHIKKTSAYKGLPKH